MNQQEEIKNVNEPEGIHNIQVLEQNYKSKKMALTLEQYYQACIDTGNQEIVDKYFDQMVEVYDMLMHSPGIYLLESNQAVMHKGKWEYYGVVIKYQVFENKVIHSFWSKIGISKPTVIKYEPRIIFLHVREKNMDAWLLDGIISKREKTSSVRVMKIGK